MVAPGATVARAALAGWAAFVVRSICRMGWACGARAHGLHAPAPTANSSASVVSPRQRPGHWPRRHLTPRVTPVLRTGASLHAAYHASTEFKVQGSKCKGGGPVGATGAW